MAMMAKHRRKKLWCHAHRRLTEWAYAALFFMARLTSNVVRAFCLSCFFEIFAKVLAEIFEIFLNFLPRIFGGESRS
jgi:hypothetical protein